MASPGPSTARRVFRRLHRWIALTLGLWFAVAGITGSVLVFWKELEAPPRATLASGPALTITELLKAAAAAWPAEADIFRIFPHNPGVAEPIRFEALVPDARGQERRRTLRLDPATGARIGEDGWGESWVHVIYDLHDGKLFGPWGDWPVGFAGIAFLLLISAGAWLWTRHDTTPLREGLRPVGGLRGLRRRRNLHRSIGIWAALPLAIAALTGVTLSFPGATRSVLAPLGTAGAPAVVRTEKPSEPAGPITLDEAIALARAAFPGWPIAWIDLPVQPRGLVGFALRTGRGGVEAPARVTVNTSTAVVEAAQASNVETMRAWFMALHNGQAFGPMHRGAVVGFGLLPGALGVIGLLIWWRRRAHAARARDHSMTISPRMP